MPALIQVNNLAKEYGGKKIFSDLSFAVNKKQKIGVIGKNGAGKSTLFKLILGLEKADNGEILIDRDVNIGYLKQEENFLKNESGLDYLRKNSAQEEWTCKKLASKFQLTEDRLAIEASKLSGGWKMRLKLVAMLLCEPTLFLLDEPTNYLDLNTLILLEEFLKSYNQSFMIISHDREFLKKTCTETLEIASDGCYLYPGPLEEYLEFKEQKMSSILKTNEGLKKQQEHLREFVDRFKAKASKAKQAQAMIRKIDKLEAKRITIEHQAGITRITMPSIVKRKSMALKVKNMSIGYNEPIVKNINFDLTFGEKLAILGLNGQGKTTLLKTLADVLKPISGSYHWFSGGQLAYHSQEAAELLNMSEQVGDYLRRIAAPDVKTEQVLKMAGDFLFKGDDLKKPIFVLSGGEKSRLMLAGMLLAKPDMLILDEPTSHLDFEAVEALGTALKKFNGAIIFTSHDRTFTNLIASEILEITNGAANYRYQSYDDYVAELEIKLAASTNEIKPKKSDQTGRENYLEQKNKQKEISALEKELSKLNQQHAELMYYFTEHPVNYNVDKVLALDKLNAAIKTAEEKWFNLQF
ncbi:MAG: ABC-F family ATP-binding cassette domain-containing protein [Patescibacteria group bacterium]|nr:ABC-F family ATP-binding cassette domain-containing protein [Patescibacteria group bacterium]